MSIPTKPILYPGFKIKSDITVVSRTERVYFTEIYSLSNGKVFYLFSAKVGEKKEIQNKEVIDEIIQEIKRLSAQKSHFR